jgi:DNA-binding PadR family transcriptional regulator
MILNFQQIAAYLQSNPLPGFTPPSADEVESAIETLVRQGIVETLWSEDGQVTYRLTREGKAHAQAMFGGYI